MVVYTYQAVAIRGQPSLRIRKAIEKDARFNIAHTCVISCKYSSFTRSSFMRPTRNSLAWKRGGRRAPLPTTWANTFSTLVIEATGFRGRMLLCASTGTEGLPGIIHLHSAHVRSRVAVGAFNLILMQMLIIITL